MTIQLTATKATLTANTVKGPVTVTMHREKALPKALQRILYAIHHSARPRFRLAGEGVQQLTF